MAENAPPSIDDIFSIVGQVIEGVGKIVNVVRGNDGNLYYVADNGNTTPVGNVTSGNNLDTNTVVMLLILVLFLKK